EIESYERAGILEAGADGGRLAVVRQRKAVENLNAVGDLTRGAARRREVDVRRAFLFNAEIDAGIVRRPNHILRRTHQIAGPQGLAAAIFMHQVKARNVIGVHLFVVAGVGDPGAVRRNLWIAIRTFAIRERFDFERREINGVNLAVVAQVFGVGFANARDVDRFAVG